MSRRKSRELVMQYLYQQDIQDERGSGQARDFWQRHRTDSDTEEFARKLLDLYWEDPAAVDQLIAEHLKNWKLNRMAIVDRNILRMAVSELLTRLTPGPVVIDEAIEIARKFGGGESKDFINGVLDAVCRKLQGEEEPEQA